MKKDLLTLHDYSAQEILDILSLAGKLKRARVKRQCYTRKNLRQRNVALIFEKPSLRTRVTFQVAMNDLLGNAIYLAPESIQIGKRESVRDTALNLERWVDAIVARTFAQETIVDLAQHARIPVINALSDDFHPCQALALAQTLQEQKGEVKGKHVAFVGDGNNVCHSIMILCAKLGMHFTHAHPEDYAPSQEVTSKAKEYCRQSDGSVSLTHVPKEAVSNADLIYTDAWASMGQEAETAKRRKVFSTYQVNAGLMKKAPSGCLVSHCLPAHRGEEITDEILDGPSSVAFDEAENRLHVQKAILLTLIA